MRRGLAFRLAALVLSAAGLIFVFMSAIGYYLARETLLRNAEEHARTVARSVVDRIESRLAPIPRVPLFVARELEDGTLGLADILRRERQVLDDNDEISGMTVAFEPGAGETNAPYATYRSPLGLRSARLGGPNYRYQYADWYQLPRELGRTVWTEPYFDERGSRTLMTTCAVPFIARGESQADGGAVAGVVTADVSLEWLKRLLASVNVLRTGYAYLITGTGTYVTHPAPGVAFNQTIFSRAEEFGDDTLRRIGRRMIQGRSGFEPVTSLHMGKKGFLVYAPLHSTGWAVAVFYPEDELLADVNRQALISGALGGGGFLLLFALIAFLSRSVTRPLSQLTAAAREVAGGNLEAALPALRSRDEVRDLAEAFGHMQVSLKEHIRNLTEATASRERLESELRIARDIQMGILPKDFTPFPGRREIDLFASLAPAREVGGDFYDFFPCGEDQLCFLVGDVSGKGVPAAFYMAVAKTLLKAEAGAAGEREGTRESRGAGTPDPGRVLARVGEDLAKDNESCMFVTIFCAVLDMRTGGLRYASAGHNPPLLMRAGSGPEYLPSQSEPVAGAMTGVTYTTQALTLVPGDAILLYTDGVTEAMDPDRRLFGEEQLRDLAARLAAPPAGSDARRLCEGLAAEVHAFARGAEQSDDITMLVLRYLGTGKNPG